MTILEKKRHERAGYRSHQEEIDATRDVFECEQAAARETVANAREAERDVFKPANPPQVKATFYFGLRIDTGDTRRIIPPHEFEEFISGHFDGLTIEHCNGIWKRNPEPSVKVTVFGDDTGAFRHECRQVAERYNTAFDQECVLLSFERVEYALVSWPGRPDKYRQNAYQ
jgi:hypothetical protein